MGLVNDLFDRLGEGRYHVDGLPELPPNGEWLLREVDGIVYVELYYPDPMTCSYNWVRSTEPADVLACAQGVFDGLFGEPK